MYAPLKIIIKTIADIIISEAYLPSIRVVVDVDRAIVARDDYQVETGTLTRETGSDINVGSGTVINYADMPATGWWNAFDISGGAEIGQKGDTLTIDAAILTYQLMLESVSYYPPQTLIGYPNGTIYVLFETKETKSYDSGIETDLDIEDVISVNKLEGNVTTPIDLDDISITGNNTFTIAGASDNETYQVTYEYSSSESTLPLIEYTYKINMAAAIDGHSTAISENNKAINDFINYQNALNILFDFRLTTLEP